MCTVRNTQGEVLPDVVCDVWEGDVHRFYDVQNPNRGHRDGRAVLRSDKDGAFHFITVMPVPYPIPMDGPVGSMLTLLNRHPNRPGDIHFMFRKEGYDPLITALYPRGDPYVMSDPVFGVKESLVVDLGLVDESLSRTYNVPAGIRLLTYNFVLVPEQEARELRDERMKEALQKLGLHMSIINGLPVPDVD